MAGYLPFEDSNLMSLYKKIYKADFTCPPWFSTSAKKLVKRILDPNPVTQITTSEVLENEWFKKGYKQPIFEQGDTSLDDVEAIFDDSVDSGNLVVELREDRPVPMNAFELISTSQGLNLSTLFEKQMGLVKRETRFTSKRPAKEIVSKIEEAATPLGFNVKKNHYKVVHSKGYDGAKADLWPCGVIIFILMAGYLPFEDSNLMSLYKKIYKADFTCPPWFSTSAKKLVKRILDPNPVTQITTSEVLENEWFKKGYKQPIFEQGDTGLDDVEAIFDDSVDSGNLVVELREDRPVPMNAFELISTSQGLNLSTLFEKQMGLVKRETRFTSKRPAKEIVSKIEEAATPLGFNVKKNHYKVVHSKGYDGAKADLWPCGVIIFILMAGYLPFEDSNLMSLYKKIYKADFTCPPWFSTSAKKLVKRILDPNPVTQITTSEVLENEWFKKGYKQPIFEQGDTGLDDVEAIFDDSVDSGNLVVELREDRPVPMNAFELISTSQGLNLSTLFEKQMGLVKRETRFTSKRPAKEIVSKIEEAATPLGFNVKKNHYKVVHSKGYDGAKADLWPCGVIIFILMAGYLPFEDSNLMSLYKKIYKADFTCPPWFSTSAKKLVKRILDPNPVTQITTSEVLENEWFKKGYKQPIFEQGDTGLDDVEAIFDDSVDSGNLVVELREDRPVPMNAFELISTSQGLNLSTLFEKQMGLVKRETRFTSKRPAKEIVSKIEEAATPLGFNVKKNHYKVVHSKGYDGAKADLWPCGVIIFILMAGYLPFEDSNLMSLYKKIYKADFTCPPWFSTSAKKLVKRILDPNPVTQITTSEVLENEWFKKGYKQPIFEQGDTGLDDVEAIFDDSVDSGNLVVELREDRPVPMNAFELISTSQGLNLSTLFEKQMGLVKRETRFTSKRPAKEIVSKIEEAATPLGFNVKKNHYKTLPLLKKLQTCFQHYLRVTPVQ